MAAQLRWLEDWVQHGDPSVRSLQRAYKTAEALVQDHPTLPVARYWLAWVQYRKRDYPSAMATLLKAKRLRRSAALQDTLFERLLQLQMGLAKATRTERGSVAISAQSNEPLESLLRHNFSQSSHEQWLQRKFKSRSMATIQSFPQPIKHALRMNSHNREPIEVIMHSIKNEQVEPTVAGNRQPLPAVVENGFSLVQIYPVNIIDGMKRMDADVITIGRDATTISLWKIAVFLAIMPASRRRTPDTPCWISEAPMERSSMRSW